MNAEGAPLRVLIIDDSEISREVLEGVIEAGGMQAMSLSSALGATAVIAKHDIRVLVVDMNMPLMSGSAFGAVFRKNERLSHVKLILITGDSETELRRVGGRLGADAVLTKDRVASDLCPTIRRVLEASRPVVAATPQSNARQRVFILDADRKTTDELARRLTMLGFEAVVRPIGKGTLAAVVDAQPALVIVGENLHDMPGRRVAELILESRQAKSIPIALLASANALTDASPALLAGIRGVVPRNLDDHEFRDRVKRLLGT